MKLRILWFVLPFVLGLPAAHSQKPARGGDEADRPAAKKLYKWVDPEGNVSYHDEPPPEGSSYRAEEKNIHIAEPPAPAKKTEDASLAGKPVVLLYAVPKCAPCDMARAYLQRRQVPFTEKNVEGNRVLLEELKRKAGSLSVPTILVGEKVMNGYVESLLAGELDAAGYPPEPPETPAPAPGGAETKPRP